MPEFKSSIVVFGATGAIYVLVGGVVVPVSTDQSVGVSDLQLGRDEDAFC